MTLNKKHCLIFLTIFLALILGTTMVSATDDTNNTQGITDNKEISTPQKYDVDKMVQNRVSNTNPETNDEKINNENKTTNTKTITKKDTIKQNTKQETQPITVNDYTELKTALTSTTYDDLTITLKNDLTSNGPITINNAIKNLVINGNSKTINGNSQAFLTANNMNLTIKNMTITNCAASNAPVLSSTNSNITILDSNITNCRSTSITSGANPNNGVLYIPSGVVTLEGNIIEGNTVSGTTNSFILLLPQTSKIVNNTFINNVNTRNSGTFTYDSLLSRKVNEIHDNEYIGNYLSISLDFRELDLNIHDQTEIYDDVLFNLYVLINDKYNDTVRNGTIYVDTNDEQSYYAPVVNGTAKIELSYAYIKQQVKVGSYSWKTVWFSYFSLEDNSYESSISNSTEFIPKSIKNPSLTASVNPSSGRVGDTFTIKGTLNGEYPISANKVTLTIGDYVAIGNTDANGEVYFNYTPDNLGIYTATLTVAAHGGIGNARTKSVTFTVEGDPSYISIYTNETEVTGAKPVKVYGVLTNMTGDPIGGATVNLTFKNQYKASTITNDSGEYSFEYITDLADDTANNLRVTYGGDAAKGINATSNTTKLTVNPYKTNITFTASDTQYGGQTNVTGFVYDIETGEVIQSGQVSIKLTNVNNPQTANIVDGKFEYLRSYTNIGTKTAEVTFIASGLYASSVNTTTFTVTKGITNATINNNGPIKVGGTLTVSGRVANDFGNHIGSKVNINVTMGTETHNVLTTNTGTYSTTFTLTEAKDYDIIVEWEGNTNYFDFKNTTVFSLYKIPTITNVSVVDDIVNRVTIDVSVRENDTKFTGNITSGYINVTVGENSKLYPITGNTTRIALSDEVNITTTDPVMFKVEFVESDVDLNSTGINNTTGEVITMFTARPVASRITVEVSPKQQNITRNVTISGEVFDEFDNPVENGNVTIDIDGKEPILVPFTGGRYEYNFTTDTGGQINFNVTFNATKTESGSILIQESRNNSSFIVNKLPTITNVELLNNSYNNVTIRVNVTTTSDEENFVTTGLIYVYDFIHSELLEQEVQVGNRSVNLTLPLEPGTNKLLVYYQENNIYLESNYRNETAFTFDKDVYVINVEKIPSITVVEKVLSNKSGEVTIRVNVTNTTGSLIPTGHVSVFNATSGELLGEGDLDNGKADILLPGLTEPGDARINITYEGNTHYLPSNARGNTHGQENTTTITVTVDPRITINMTRNMTVIGQQVTIYGNVYNEIGVMLSNANVIVTINGQEYPAGFDTETGEYNYIYTPTSNGTITVNASYLKDETKQATSESLELLVNKINSTTDIVRVVNSTLGNVSLEIRVEGADGNTSMNGKLNITIEGYIPVKADYTGESIIVPLGDHIRRSGLITVLVEFQENDAYLASSIDVLIPVDAERPILELAIEKATVQVGENAVITGNLADNRGNKISDAYIEISINDKLVTTVRTDEDGAFRYTYNTTEAGENIPVNAVYRGDDTRYDPTSNTTKFSVTKKTIYTINVSAENITYGDIETIIISLPSDANDNVNINIPDYIADTVKAENGRAVYIIGAYNISAGEYNVTVTYSDDKYATKTNTTIFKVTKSATTLTVNVTSPVKAGQSTLITGTLVDATGKPVSGEKVEVKVDNKLVASPVTNAYGKYTITFNDTIVGTHNVGASYNGNNNYMNSTAATTLTVEKLNTKITIDTIKDVPVTENVVISAKVVDEKAVPVASAQVKVSFDGKTQNVTSDNNGNIRVTIPTSTVGNKEVIVIYDGNSKYNPSNMESTARVVKNNATITLSMPSNVKVDQTATVKGKVTDKNGKTLPNIPVNVTVNGKTIPTVTDSNGNFQVEANNVREGTNNVTATASNANYNINSASGKFTATRKEAKLTVDPIKDSKLKDNITITGKLVDEQNKPISYAPVQVTVNGKTSTVTTDKNGNYQLPATGIVEGTNNVSVKYEDPEYKTQTVKASFKASTSKTVVKVPSITGVIGEDITLTAYVTDDDGKPVSGGNIVFKLNGKTLRTDGRFDTNSSPLKLHVENGVVKYTIKADLYLRNGKNITASYSGSSKYDAAKANVATANIKKRNAQVKVTITPNKAVQNTDIVFTATLSDVTPGATNKTSLTTDANIIFKVNGVTIKDKNGKADRIRVTHSVINYAYHVPTGMGGVDDSGVKNYTVEAVYDNPVFYPDTRNSSVFHVQRSIINVNFIKTGIKNNVLSVKARFTDYENKNVVGNNKVCVKINGITYKENGEVKYFTVKDGNVDLTGIKIAKGTNVKEVMLVTGAREGYMGARATTTEITS
ncbi:Ig-like domain repeat protein [Methanosphaera sp. ISO3-F5]|uniref:Ig-like domain repeat protein n=1 Tax=Methanosphaera sp. ISO3-F5 TaxID=1452353 RepID=UPI002B26189F|nr:Ig-like domain repeat protein [Methanosphaera sp. ISO3-F5]WQH63938.1 Ig-like domain repeat protein [Methanosphaera sp. ISO3-F5]